MKNIKIYIVLLTIFTCAFSCDFLETEPLTFLGPDNYFDSEEKLESNLAGVYRSLASNDLYGFWYIYRLGLEGDESYYYRTTPPVGPQIHDFTASDGDIDRAWRSCWIGINRANTLLANVDINEEIDIEFRDRIRGEALFLRAYYYFLLVSYWGDVPLKLLPTDNANAIHIPRDPAKEVYEQIIKDMTEAESLVADIRDIGFGGRVSKSAVRGILARVCLHMAGFPVRDQSKYEEARKWAKKVIDDTDANHKLLDDFSQVFINYAQDKYDVDESIWEIEFYGNATEAFTNWGGVGYVTGPRTTNTDIGYSTGSLRTTYKHYKAYEEGDLRRDWTIANFTYDNTTGAKKYLTDTTIVKLYDRDMAKYRREYEILLPKSSRATPQNYPVLRYSDVLLMFAEADNEVNNGPTPLAIEAVNEVRRRAWSSGIKSIEIQDGGSGYTSAPIVSFSGGGGNGAKAVSKIDAKGSIVAITLLPDPVIGLSRGSDYDSAPEIVLEGGVSEGTIPAIVSATIYKKTDGELSSSEVYDYESFKQFIQDERMRELSNESLRKSDLIRWGIFIYEMHKIRDHIKIYNPNANYLKNFANIQEKHLLWPIPINELSTNNAMTQNPNW